MASRTFRSFKQRNARLYFMGLLVSTIGTWIQVTATSALVYKLTGKATDVGLTIGAQFLPTLILGAWAGGLSDRTDRRVLTLITQSLLMVQAVAMAALTLADRVTMPWVYVLSGALGLVNAIDNPARRGFVLDIVPAQDIGNAIALNTATMTGSRVFGPAIAALLIRFVGIGWCFAANAVTFAAILFALTRIDVARLHSAPLAKRGGRPVREAIAYIASQRRLLVLFIVLTVVSTFAFNYGVSFVRLVDQRFDNEDLFGWLLATSSIGNVVGALWMARKENARLLYMFGGIVMLAISGLIIAWSPHPAVAFAASVPLGFGGSVMVASSNTMLQEDCPPEMRGRLLALCAVAFLGSTPIGSPITGWIADNVSAEWSIAYGSLISLAAVAVGWLAMRNRPLAVPPAAAV